jgi:threonyl-tRNA synthetase
MKILLIHADYFEYEVKSPAVKKPEEAPDAPKKDAVDEVLVAFCTIEKMDEQNPEQVAHNAVDAIEEHAQRIKVKNICIYPYAHLSSDLGSATVAIPLLRQIAELLKEKGYNVKRSPFGWNKAFNIKCKGHPLAEHMRSVTAEAKKLEVPVEVEKGELIILETNGEEYPLDLQNLEACPPLSQHPLLKQFILSEEVGEVTHEAPPHIRLMKKLELVDYEPASDVGHFRYYPKGALIKDLLQEYAAEIAIKNLHAIKIETPLIYRLDQPDIAGQAARFREKDYRFKLDEKEFVLRFAGDFGLFRMMRDATISYKQLPIRVYELSHSFRYEQSGECVGLRRLRAFTMPDIHAFSRDLEQGKDEFEAIFREYTRLADSMEVDYIIAFRVVKEFYEKNREWLIKLLGIAKKPALIELLPEMKHYWIVKSEHQAIDSVGGAGQLCTVQLDIEDSERYGILYVDSDGKKKGCIIVHSSMGSTERWIYAMLEKAAAMQKQGKPPMLPIWLSPIQVRVIPVSPEHLEYARSVLEKFREHRIRVDVDDRDETLASKVRDAETEWIPYIIVVGEKERSQNSVTMRIRGNGQKQLSVEDAIKEVNMQIGDKPRTPLYLPASVSLKPKFTS